MPGDAPLAATICVVNYRTLELTRLCLRSLRRFTGAPHEVVVVDNDSRDASLDYLRGLRWIRLVERRADPPDPSAPWAHAAALDAGLAACRTPIFVSLHSDAFVRRAGWLESLLAPFAADPRVASVGTGKIEGKPAWRRLLARAGAPLDAVRRRLLGRAPPAARERHFNRTICCLYRADVLRRERLGFVMGLDDGFTAGQMLHYELEDRGHATVALPERALEPLVVHLGHATQVVNAREFSLRRRTVAATERRIARLLASPEARAILADDSLDR
jgi:hypothetical protein